MAKAKHTRKSVPTGHVQPFKKKLGRPKKQQPLQQSPLSQQSSTVGDQHEPELNMPVTKSELMLISLALQQYRSRLINAREFSENVRNILLRQTDNLEKKVLSNEVSWDALYGKVNG